MKKIWLSLLVSMASFNSVLAVGNIITPEADGIKDFASLLKMIIKSILDLMVPVIVLAIVYVGFLFVKAQGNEGKLTEAKQALVWVLIGTAVIIGSNALYSIFYAALPV